MITVKEAVKIAIEYLKELLPSTPIYGVEEVEKTDDSKYWLITIAISDEHIPLANVLGAGKRKYKIVQVNTTSGDVKSVKIRKFD